MHIYYLSSDFNIDLKTGLYNAVNINIKSKI